MFTMCCVLYLLSINTESKIRCIKGLKSNLVIQKNVPSNEIAQLLLIGDSNINLEDTEDYTYKLLQKLWKKHSQAGSSQVWNSSREARS